MRLKFRDEERTARSICGRKQERVHSFGPKTLRYHHFEEKVRDGIKIILLLLLLLLLLLFDCKLG
jgi:hypothetical protein